MAKEQSLSLNPTKISGTCGRLMCCLKYEQNCYEELLAITPKVGALVETAGRGIVEDTNLLTGVLKVNFDKNPDAAATAFKREDVKLLKDGKIRIKKNSKRSRGLRTKVAGSCQPLRCPPLITLYIF